MTIQETYTAHCKDWVEYALKDLPVTEGYFIGSANQSASPNDVDILLLVDYSDTKDMRRSSLLLEKVQKRFLDRFSLPLHMTVCYKLEATAFYDFKDRALKRTPLITIDWEGCK